jgi:hypothetical protein
MTAALSELFSLKYLWVHYSGLEIIGRKDAKCVCFFIFASENCHVNDKKCVCIFQQVYKNCTFLPLSCSEMCVFCF